MSTSLVQCLIERWWDTTHTFHIAKREMMVIPYDFHRMTSLSFKGDIISLDDVPGFQLGLDMLGRKYSIKNIRYFDLVSDYMFLPQRTGRSVSVWLGLSFSTCWGPNSLPMMGNGVIEVVDPLLGL